MSPPFGDQRVFAEQPFFRVHVVFINSGVMIMSKLKVVIVSSSGKVSDVNVNVMSKSMPIKMVVPP